MDTHREVYYSLSLAAALLCSCATAPVAPPPAVAAPAAPVATPGISDGSLGLSKGSVFDVAEPKPFAFSKESPGGNDRLPGAYQGAPPRIPHGISDYLPITVARNQCLKCHDVAKPATPDPDAATPIPASHHVDLRNAPGVQQKEIAGARWVCTTCHVPQAPASAPAVGNGFKPAQ